MYKTSGMHCYASAKLQVINPETAEPISILGRLDGGRVINSIFAKGVFTLVPVCNNTLPIAEILSGKNARAWVSIDFT